MKGIPLDVERALAFTTEQAPGAWPNGSRVIKLIFEEGDAHQVGDLATVIGSLGPFAYQGSRYGYFVIWDDTPDVPVFSVDKKLGLASRGGGDA